MKIWYDGDDPQGALQHKQQVTDQFKLLDEDDYPNRLNTAHRLLGYDRKVSPQEYLNQLLELSDRNYTKKQAQKYNLIHPNTIWLLTRSFLFSSHNLIILVF